MKNTFILLFAALLAVLNVSAADTSIQARKVLDKAASVVNIKKGATANFSISGGKIGNQSGTISIKGNKFTARTSSAIIWYNGKTQWLYNKSSNEVNVSAPRASQQQAMNPYHFLTLYKQGYTISMDKTASRDYNIHLVGKGKSISEMYVLVDRSYNIKQVKMKQGSQWMTITISNFTQKTLSDNIFNFNAKDYPKAEIIDLR